MRIYNKLVRDKIPQIIKADGKKLKSRILDDQEHLEELFKKLGEELEELKEARSVDELADVKEIVHALADALGVSQDELEKVRVKKAKDRGAFKNKIFLESVED